MKEENSGIEISLRDLFIIFFKKLWLIILSVILCAGGTYFYNKNYITPLYRSSVMFYVVPISNIDPDYSEYAKLQIEYQSLVYAKQIINTYLQIFNTNTFRTKLFEDYTKNYGKALNGSISVSEIMETELFIISVVSTSKEDAYEIALQIEKTAPEMIIETIGNDTLRVVDKPIKATGAINNNTIRNTFLGAVIGAMLSYGAAFLIFILDRRIKSEEDLKNNYDIPILCGIVDFNKNYKDTKQY